MCLASSGASSLHTPPRRQVNLVELESRILVLGVGKFAINGSALPLDLDSEHIKLHADCVTAFEVVER